MNRLLLLTMVGGAFLLVPAASADQTCLNEICNETGPVGVFYHNSSEYGYKEVGFTSNGHNGVSGGVYTDSDGDRCYSAWIGRMNVYNNCDF